MNVALLFNPVAGAGRGVAAAESLRADLLAAGHDVLVQPTVPQPAVDWLATALDGVELLVVAGGDGAVRLASAPAIRAGIPLYPFPLGTENLFARELGIERSSRQLLDALERFEVRHVDAGAVGDLGFLLMVSMGFDASVVQDLAARRSGAIRHRSYLAPLLRQLLHWRPPELSLDVDGTPVVEGRVGFVVIANSRQYAVRLDPARRASMTDGLLDVVFFPCASRAALLAWMLACRSGRQMRDPRLVYRTGRRIQLRSRPAHAFQIDGDAPGPTSPAAELTVGVRPGALPLLVPGPLSRR